MNHKNKKFVDVEDMLHVPCPMFCNRGGFTIIELMVAVAVFVVLTGIAMGGFARAIRIQREAQQLLAANSNASLALETMARDMRTGRSFCHPTPGNRDLNAQETYRDCIPIPQGSYWGSYNKLAFVDSNNCEVAYYVSGGLIMKDTISGLGCVLGSGALTSNNVIADYLSFQIMGNQSFDQYPPRITIFLGIHPSGSDPNLSQSVIHLQTTVSSRQPDG